MSAPDSPHFSFAAFILVGGKSSRMGRDKAFVEFRGTTLLARALALARSVTPRVSIVGRRDLYAAFGPVVEDQFPDHGPLGGIHAALSQSDAAFNLMLAVDMPLVTAEFLAYLCAQAQASSALVTVPQVGSRWQPLCAVYRKEFAAVAAAALRQDHNRIDRLFTEVPVQVLIESSLDRWGFSAALFANYNSPDDLALGDLELEPHPPSVPD